MSICVTIAHESETEILKNHKHYCSSHGYTHIRADQGMISNVRMFERWKFHLLYQQLISVPEGGLVILLHSDCVFYKQIELEALMQGIDFLAIDSGLGVDIEHLEIDESGKKTYTFPVQTNCIIARNVADTRTKLMQYISELHEFGFKGKQSNIEESAGLRNLTVFRQDQSINGYYLNVTTRTNWNTLPTFIVNIGDSYAPNDSLIAINIIQHKHLAEPILLAINNHVIDGEPLFTPPATKIDKHQENTRISNPTSKIAFVMLYTPNISSYANIAEDNLQRYCDIHHYAFHVYRDVPDEHKALNISGNWLKPRLLNNIIEQYEWVFWIDADVLVLNPQQKIESLLNNRDLLFAKDIATWQINSGVMGFRNTEKNKALLQDMCEKIDALEDKTSVYVNQGDQYHIIQCLQNHDVLNETSVVDCLTINTPPIFKREDTFMVHYAGEPSPLREIHMAHDDKMLQTKMRPNYANHARAVDITMQKINLQ